MLVTAVVVWVVLACGAALFIERAAAAEAAAFDAAILRSEGAIGEALQQVRFLQQMEGVQPSLRWSGSGAAALKAQLMRSHSLLGVEGVHWNVLARTASGRYFTGKFAVQAGARCDAAAIGCLYDAGFHPLDEAGAKLFVFRAGDDKLYRALFGEPMPPREIPA